MLLSTIIFTVAWMLLSVLLVWAFYIAFKMRKRTKGISLIYAFAPAIIILVNVYIIPFTVRGPSLAWFNMILSPDVWAGHLLILLAFFASVCLLLIAIIAATKMKAHPYAKLIGLYLAVGATTALLISIYGLLR